MSLINPIIANAPIKEKPGLETRMSNSSAENNFQHGLGQATLLF